MKSILLLAAYAAFGVLTASATSVSCTVTSGTVLTSAGGGLSFTIANGIGTATGGATGVISCPAITTGIGTITNYQVLATGGYTGGPFGTISGTTVTEVFTLVGGSLNGSSTTLSISGGATPTGFVPPVPFQIGSTLSGATSYAAFTVNVASSITAGGPVGTSSGQVVISYDVAAPTNGVPEPSTYALLSFGLVGMGLLRRRMTRQ